MKILKKIKYFLLILFLCIKKSFKIGLGDEIIYNNKRYLVVNGIYEDKWTISLNKNSLYNVPRKSCKKVKSVHNYLKSFKSHYSFYFSSWFDIWVRNGIKPWMKGCNIW